jgi:hypothetical protein
VAGVAAAVLSRRRPGALWGVNAVCHVQASVDMMVQAEDVLLREWLASQAIMVYKCARVI